MKLVLKCWSSNEHYNADCDYAVVNLTPKLARLMQSRIELFVKLRDEALTSEPESRLREMHYTDFHADFISESGVSEVLDKDLSDNDDEVFPLPFALPDYEDNSKIYQSTEYERMLVSEGIRFCATPRHTSIDITTAEITADYIEEALQEQEVPQ